MYWFSDAVLRELDDVRKNVIEDINNYFREKEKEILMQTSKYSGMQSKVNGLKK